jgi:hypothetical protein
VRALSIATGAACATVLPRTMAAAAALTINFRIVISRPLFREAF